MAYSVDSDNLPDNVKTMAAGVKALWVRTYNSVIARGKSDGVAKSAANKMVRSAKASAETGELEEEVTDEALQAFVDTELAADDGPSRTYLTRLRDLLKGSKGKPVDDKMIEHIIKSSAGHAGGTARAAASKKTAEITDFRVLYQFADAPDTINVLPVPGTYKHPRYGTIKITKERNQRFVDNFENAVYQDKLPIDAEHETKLSGAFGWMTGLKMNSDGSVDATVEWTDRGMTAFENDRFKYFSPEWYDAWQDPATGETYSDVLIGGAVTTRPFFKDPALKPLVASELEIDDSWEEPESYGEVELPDGMSFDDVRRLVEGALKKKFPNTGKSEMYGPWVTDMFEDYCIFCSDDGVYKKVAYTIDDNSQVTLGETAMTVERKTIWRPTVAAEEIQQHTVKPRTMDVTATGGNEVTQSFAETEEYKAMSEEITSLKAKLDEANKASEEATKATEALKAAETRIENLEKSARRARFAEIVKSPRWYGEVDSNVETLEALADAFGEDSERFKSFVEREKARAAAMQSSELFQEKGHEAQAAEGSEFRRALQAYREQHADKTEAEAMEAVLTANPKFYEDYRRQMNEAASRGRDEAVRL